MSDLDSPFCHAHGRQFPSSTGPGRPPGPNEEGPSNARAVSAQCLQLQPAVSRLRLHLRQHARPGSDGRRGRGDRGLSGPGRRQPRALRAHHLAVHQVPGPLRPRYGRAGQPDPRPAARGGGGQPDRGRPRDSGRAPGSRGGRADRRLLPLPAVLLHRRRRSGAGPGVERPGSGPQRAVGLRRRPWGLRPRPGPFLHRGLLDHRSRRPCRRRPRRQAVHRPRPKGRTAGVRPGRHHPAGRHGHRLLQPPPLQALRHRPLHPARPTPRCGSR